MSETDDIWLRVNLALTLLEHDPKGLKGICFRLRSGPVKTRVMAHIEKIAPRIIKLHPNMSDEQLFGGLDVVATLQHQKLVHSNGLLRCDGWHVLTMAERCPTDMAAKLAQHLDSEPNTPLIVFDEGIEDEAAPSKITERIAFQFDLSAQSYRTVELETLPITNDYPKMCKPDTGSISQLVMLANSFGIASPRAALFALKAAQINARLNARTHLLQEDLEIAAELVYPHRATQIPAPESQEEQPPQQQKEETDTGENDTGRDKTELPDELLIEAVQALLPAQLDLSEKKQTSFGKTKGLGFGTQLKGLLRGRPKQPRQARLTGQNRLDIIATLRSAAPFQTMRRASRKSAKHLHIYPDDLHIKQYETRSERVIIFAVDASGSAAVSRLSEAKGAVELLLAEAYSRRDFVSLIGFRNTRADVLLPPTRSLVQTKRRLADLPGGGGTPLAHGLGAAYELALQSGSRGKTPMIVLLTDGRANIDLDGNADRTMALDHARKNALLIAANGIRSITLDVGNRPNRALADLSNAMRGCYFPLPRADAHKIKATINTELEAV